MHEATLLEEKILTEVEIIGVNLPNNWWNSSYSYNFYSAKNKAEVKIIPIKTNKDKIQHKINKNDFSKTLGYDLSKGDYHIQETYSSKKDYAYHNRIKIRITKYAVYPALVFALLLTFSILSIIVETPL